MIRLLFMALVAGIVFYAIPFWDMLFNKSHLNTALVHFFTQTWIGGITMVLGLFLALVMSVCWFIPARK